MSHDTEVVPFRTKLRIATSNFLQKNRMVLLAVIAAVILVTVALTIWTQVDAASKISFAEQIEKSQADYILWQAEADAAKKADLGATLEKELAQIQKDAPVGYGLVKAWFVQGNYLSSQKKWAEAAAAYYAVFEKDHGSYLAPIALVNSAVSREEAGDDTAAAAAYDAFEKAFANDSLLAPQVFFTQGRLLEKQKKTPEAIAAYQKLLDKFPESGWTKLGRDRILFLSQD